MGVANCCQSSPYNNNNNQNKHAKHIKHQQSNDISVAVNLNTPEVAANSSRPRLDLMQDLQNALLQKSQPINFPP